MPTIRIDEDVYAWLQSLATPFEDNPNTVLRKIAGLSNTPPAARDKVKRDAHPAGPGRLSGRVLNDRWEVGARHALYHRDGTFYEKLKRFPGALFDPHGYIVFKTEAQYRSSPYIKIGEKLNVPGGIASIPGYVKVQA